MTKQAMASLTDVVLISGWRELVMVICRSMRWCNFKGEDSGRI